MNTFPRADSLRPKPDLPVTTIIVDDDREICRAMQALFETEGDIEVLATGYSAEEAIALAAEHHPQVILLDLHFENGMSGIEAIKQISARADIKSRVLVYTISARESTIFEAIKAGASSYVWKHEGYADLIEAVFTTARGESFASPTVATMVLEFLEHPRGEEANELEVKADPSLGG